MVFGAQECQRLEDRAGLLVDDRWQVLLVEPEQRGKTKHVPTELEVLLEVVHVLEPVLEADQVLAEHLEGQCSVVGEAAGKCLQEHDLVLLGAGLTSA